MTEMIRVITGDGFPPSLPCLLPSDHSFALSIQRGVVTHAIPIERLSRLLQCEVDGGAEEEAMIGRQFHLPAKKREFSVLGADTNDNTKAAAG